MNRDDDPIVEPADQVDADAAPSGEDIEIDPAGTEDTADPALNPQANAVEMGRLLEDARAKADDHYDQLVRARAELDNVKKRHERELENLHKYALERFVGDLVGVWDSLELGHNAAQDETADVDSLREGTGLTLKLLTDVMTKFGVEQVDPDGERFNPELHQAMSLVSRNDVPPNTVVTVIQKGCTLNGRLIRPAMVMVSQAVENDPHPPGGGGFDAQA